MTHRDHTGPPPAIQPAPPDSPPIIDPALLDVLLDAKTPLPIGALAQLLNSSVDRIQHELARLEAAGCCFQRHPQHGVQLVDCDLGAWVDYLHWASPHRPPPATHRVIEVYRTTTSTQDAAKRLFRARGDDADRAVVIADEQTAGRGRLGRSWFAPPGSGVTFSLITRMDDPSPQQTVNRLMLASAVALAQAITPLIQPAQIEIKWPNDLLVEGAKLAGILVETSSPTTSGTHGILGSPAAAVSHCPWWAVIGIGVNVTLTQDQIPNDLSIPSVHYEPSHARRHRTPLGSAPRRLSTP